MYVKIHSKDPTIVIHLFFGTVEINAKTSTSNIPVAFTFKINECVFVLGEEV